MGRGTRLCPELFGPGMDKEDFRVFDFCFNFDFFRENPEGIEGGGGLPLGTRLFRSRVQLLDIIRQSPELDETKAVKEAVESELYREVAAMNRDNFIVQLSLETVDKYQRKSTWANMGASELNELSDKIAGLPSELELDDIESRMFDLSALKMQLAHATGDMGAFESGRKRVVDIAALLEEKSNIPAVHKQLAYLAALQETGFWEGITLEMLEEMRMRLRGLVVFLDKKTRKVVYTDFKDEVVKVHDETVVYMPKMTGVQYEKKVKEYLEGHKDSLVIKRLRTNQALTETDLDSLERTLVDIGEGEGKVLLAGLLERTGAKSLPHFVRSLVGMDRAAAKAAFSDYLGDRSLDTNQIRFIELIIDQLTARGIMEPGALYEPPFTDIHTGGPDALFAGKENVVEGIFESLKSAHSALADEAG